MNKIFKKSVFALFFSGSILFIIHSSFAPRASRLYVSNFENVLGTSLELKIASTDAVAAQAEAAALAEIDRLDHILSAYNPNSEFSNWHNGPATDVRVSDDLFNVLVLFDRWQSESSGALNAGAGAIGTLWKSAEAHQELPSGAEIKQAVRTAQATHWLLNPSLKTARRLDNSDLFLNSFVKSYIINKAANAAMKVSGVDGVVVNVGGDIVVKGSVTEEVSVSNPLADAENESPVSVMRIDNKAVATSGNYRRGYQILDKWYSHIFDPRTGLPVEQVIGATVIANDATTAGALATAFNVLSIEESAKLADRYPDVSYLIVTRDGSEHPSKNWIGKAPKTNVLHSKIARFEVLVNLELALIEGQRIHRPFVAIWVEDGDRQPVKNIAIWFNKAKWLPDLKTWYRAYGLDFNAEGNPVKSTSSATRSPGKYTVKWDGTNDAGKPVKAGTYTINVEVVREHGTYQLITQTVDVNGKPAKVTFPANTELKSASLEYRKLK